jgi:pyruvate formate lyase activating enzyme
MSASGERPRGSPVMGLVFDVREMTVHDGPGIRTTVFLKGCPLRCAWCHNPEGLSFQPEVMARSNGCVHCGLCERPCAHPECEGLGRCTRACPRGLVRRAGEWIEAEALAARLLGTADLLDDAGGGFTLSGGEPLAQPDFLFELAGLLKPHHLAIETSGYAQSGIFERAIDAFDLVMLDLKHMDAGEHLRGTGRDNAMILSNLELLVASGREFVARIPLIPGFNDSESNMRAVASRLLPARGRVRVELLPSNPLAGAKYPMLGLAYEAIHAEGAGPGIHLGPFADVGIPVRVL